MKTHMFQFIVSALKRGLKDTRQAKYSAFSCLLLPSPAFSCLLLPSPAFSCLLLPSPALSGVIRHYSALFCLIRHCWVSRDTNNWLKKVDRMNLLLLCSRDMFAWLINRNIPARPCARSSSPITSGSVKTRIRARRRATISDYDRNQA